ncbi:MAG: hypothetical protein GY940_22620, partial [bacterium]|nr:hypothetical protein [bacterium]
SKSITCDNANAVKPFGAIDTPTQGGTASGSAFLNWGWALTPQPNSIPTDGSTIDVWVDGVNLGHPVYNIYRSDIASLFPAYANSNGAVGYYYLDTTGYANGVHTIQWTVTDNKGNSDGIGSRYFSITNPLGASNVNSRIDVRSLPPFKETFKEKKQDPASPYFKTLKVRTGYNKNAPLRMLKPDINGGFQIETEGPVRLEIHFQQEENVYLSTLPIGASLDRERGILYWQPGHVFMGDYSF